MPRRIKSVLFVICVVMVFTAQTNRPDDKGQKHAPESRPAPAARQAPAARPASVAHTVQNRPQQVQVRREVAPQRTVYRQPSPVETRSFQRPQQQRDNGPRIYAVIPTAPVENNQFFHHQHHNNWRPLYNFYDNEYHFYPYVNVTSTVELSANYETMEYNGQTYYFDRGSFYVQTPQGYLAVPPPLGIFVTTISQHARQIVVDGQVYYRNKGVCYIQAEQGYQVVQQVQDAQQMVHEYD